LKASCTFVDLLAAASHREVTGRHCDVQAMANK